MNLVRDAHECIGIPRDTVFVKLLRSTPNSSLNQSNCLQPCLNVREATLNNSGRYMRRCFRHIVLSRCTARVAGRLRLVAVHGANAKTCLQEPSRLVRLVSRLARPSMLARNPAHSGRNTAGASNSDIHARTCKAQHLARAGPRRLVSAAMRITQVA